MRLLFRMRRNFTLTLLTALIASQIVAIFGTTIPVQAKTLETSSDPSEEIIYIDRDGVIRVLDTQGDPLVQWFSPTGDWKYVAVADVNNDGDMEIAAMGQVGNTTKVAVFDPVVARGALDPNKKINNIPWDTLYEVEFPAVAQYVIGGDFDTNIPGDELAIGFRDGNQNYFLRIWKAAALDNFGNPTGRLWQDHIVRDWDEERYSTGTSGQLTGEGADELVLIDDRDDGGETLLDIFIVDRDMERMDGKSSDNDKWRQAIVGQPIAGDKAELGAYVSVDRADKRSVLVYNVDGDNELDSDDDWQWAFAPQPRDIFFADLFGNGDDELFILRDHPNDNGARLLMRDDWGDDRERYDNDYDLDLDGLNYDEADGGDIDGDNKAEVVLLREDRITILTRPEDRPEDDAYIVNYIAPGDIPFTDDDTLIMGNLDATGFVQGPSFGVSQTMFDVAVPTGTTSDQFSFRVENITTDEPITFGLSVSTGGDWVILDRIQATTPATVNLRFNTGNRPVGRYEATLTLQSGQPVLNQPFEIKLIMNVEPAIIAPRPQSAAFVNMECGQTISGTATLDVRLGGTAGLKYRGAVIGVPASTIVASGNGLSGAVTGGEITENGDMILYDAAGNQQVIETPQISAAAALSTSWFIDDAVSSWVKNVYSDNNTVPSNLTVEVDLTALGDTFNVQQAVFVMVADTKAGDPPDNVYGLPITALCATENLSIPIIR